jgi:hypothetical protein
MFERLEIVSGDISKGIWAIEENFLLYHGSLLSSKRLEYSSIESIIKKEQIEHNINIEIKLVTGEQASAKLDFRCFQKLHDNFLNDNGKSIQDDSELSKNMKCYNSIENGTNSKLSISKKNHPTKKQLGIIGSITLLFGVFTPILSTPFLGNMNYIQNGESDGAIVLVLALISLVLALKKNYQGLWFTGIGSLGLILFTLISFQSKMSQARADIESNLAGNPFRGLMDMAMQSVQLQWGWIFLIAGAALIIASAAKVDSEDAKPEDKSPAPTAPSNTKYDDSLWK